MMHTFPKRCCDSGPRQFGAMGRDMDRWFDDFFQTRPGQEKSTTGGRWFAPLTLWEEGDDYFVQVEAPGVLADDIRVTVEDDTLKIEALRKAPEGESRKYWHEERRYGSAVRTIALPKTVDPESIEADLHDGVLNLKLSKRPEAKPKQVEIKVR